MQVDNSFDAIVVGSGITGGWAAKELTESGLKVLMIERGPMVEHQVDYNTETLAPWELPFHGFGDPGMRERDYPIQGHSGFLDEWNHRFFVKDHENPYQTPADRPFAWIRGYQLGGKSLLWGRQSYRWSDYDFEANKRDGHGVDWPIRYADLAPWYDKVEEFAGISGSFEALPQLPDGKFQPPMQLNHVEKAFKATIEDEFPGRTLIIGRVANMTEDKEGRSRCQYRNICSRGCSYGGYFSTQSSTLPAARATGNLTLVTDSRVVGIDYDPLERRATGVRTVNEATGTGHTYNARVIFVCGGALNSVLLLMLSRSEQFPRGLGNSSGALGRGIMDHATSAVGGTVSGFLEHNYYGNRPNGFYIPRFRNITEPKEGMLRGYAMQGSALRANWKRGLRRPGVGAEFKNGLRQPGEWQLVMASFAECLPRDANHVSLDEANLDSHGLPQLKIDVTWSDNEVALLRDAIAESVRMMTAFGVPVSADDPHPNTPGSAIHEMGGARMGHDPSTSVLNKYSQLHDVRNVFVTDGAAMSSSACQNPSLTYMAITARACASAVSMLQNHSL
ncbi:MULTISPECIES: GMC family oxidoreductase [Rhodomicrobium]|uniref:GMC oxidoreductase n=1 Tax=Rhodomicrobium TaxID=1068 RepID=UPI000B4A8D21|nr:MULTISPECIES: GMC family oxidoreductase [Rhodomicrobium]